MIEINLIPQKLKKQKQVQVVLMAGVALAVLVVVALAAVVSWQYQRIADKESEIKRIDAESASLKDKIEEVKQFRAKEDIFAKKKAIIDKLLKDQAFWPELLDRVSDMILPDMWLTEMSQSKEKDEGVIIHLAGNAMSKVLVADFLKRLEESPYVTDIKAAKISDVTDTGSTSTFASFEITFLYKRSKDQAQAAPAAPVK
jgi:Tfp pilus assembly protein PilN